jgi:predicted sulfurtransferase
MRNFNRKSLLLLAMSALLLFCTQVGAEAAGSGHPPRISMAEVQKMLDSGETVLFIDTRTNQQWQSARHKIPGAIRVDTTNDILALTRDYPADQAIVTYCT